MQIDDDDRIVIETPGAGGYGAPKERSPEAVELDFRSGKFTATYIEENFGKST